MKLKRLTAFILSFCLILTLFPIEVFADDKISINIAQQPVVDIVLTTGRTDKTGLNMTNFDTDLKNALKAMDVDVDKIMNIQRIETSSVDMSKAFDWKTDFMDKNTATSGSSGTGIGNITITNNGASVDMVGNQSLAGKNAIYTIPASDNQQKFEYSYNLAFGDSFNAAGMLLRVTKSGNLLTGYMISFNNSRWRGFTGNNSTGGIWKFEFQKGTNRTNFTPTGGSGTKITLVQPLALSMSGTVTVVTDSKYITVSGGGLASPVTVNIDSGTGAGFGFFSDHYSHGCSNIGSFKLTGIALQETSVKHFTDILKVPSWQTDSIRAIVNVNDYVEEDFSNADTLGAILSRCLNESVNYVSWGPEDTRSSNENFIRQNNNNGQFIPIASSATYSKAIQDTATYIKSLLPSQSAQGTEYVLVDNYVNIAVNPSKYKTNTITSDYPQGRWLIEHTPNAVENSTGQFVDSGIYKNNLDIESFNKVGKYDIKFQTDLIKSIIVHRMPVASFSLTVNNNVVTVNNTSYDLDSYSRNNGHGPGIKAEKWSYKESTATTWTQDKLTSVDPSKTYVIQLEVQDFQNQWSAPTTKYISGSSQYVNPVADFNFSNPQISKYNTSLTLSNASYDPKGSPITQYKWTVVKDGKTTIINEQTYSSFQYPGINFQSYGTGTYAYQLTVKNSAGLTSDPYTRYLTVIDDTEPPEVEITPQSGDWGVGVSSHVITAKFKDTDSKLASFQYAITNSSVQPASGWTGTVNYNTNTSTATQNITVSNQGTYYVHVKVIDRAGNSVILTRGPFKIDTVKPTASFVTLDELQQTLPAYRSAARSTSLALNHVTDKKVQITLAATDATSGINRVMYKLDTDTDYKNATANGGNNYVFRIEDNYVGNVSVLAYDNAGNVSDELLLTGLKLINSQPTIEITNNTDWQTGNPVQFPVKINSIDLLSISTAEFETSESTPYKNNLTHISGADYTVDLTNEGVYKFTVHAINEAGTEAYATSDTVRIDRTSPVIQDYETTLLNIIPKNTTFLLSEGMTTNRAIKIDFDISDNLSGFDHLEYQLPGELTYRKVDPGITYFTLDSAVNGNINVKAYDVAGNVSSIITIPNIIIDTVDPEINMGDTPDWTNQDVDINVTVDDDTGLEKIIWFTTESPDIPEAQGATYLPSDFPGKITLSNEGVYTLVVSAFDIAGNVTKVQSGEVKIDKTKPEIIGMDFYLPQIELMNEIPSEEIIPPIEIPEETIEPIPEENPTDPTVTPEPEVKPTPTPKPESSEEIPTPPDNNKDNNEEKPVETPVENEKTEQSEPPIENIIDSIDNKTENNETVIDEKVIDSIAPMSGASSIGNIFGSEILVQIYPRDVLGYAQSGIDSVWYKLESDDGNTITDWIELTVDSDDNYIFIIENDFTGTISAKCYDVAGNESDVYSDHVILDKTNPNPTLAVNTDSPDWCLTEGHAYIQANDINGLQSVYAEITMSEGEGEDREFEMLTENLPTEFEDDIVIYEDGIYDVSITATDIAGNTSSKTKTIKIDRTAPEVSDVIFNVVDENNNIIENDCNITNKKLLVQVDVNDNLSGFKYLEYQTMDSSQWQKVAQDVTEFYVATAYKGNIKVRAYDVAGNCSTIFVSEEIVVETEDPTLLVSRDEAWTATGVTLHVDANDVLSGIKEIYYSYIAADGIKVEERIEMIGDKVNTDIFFNKHGSYSITFTAIDNAGNSTSVVRSVNIDRTTQFKAPTVSSGDYVHDTWSSQKVVVSLGYNPVDIPISGISKYQYKLLPNGEWVDGLPELDGFIVEEYQFRAITNVGCISDETEVFKVKIDKNKPVILENAIKDNSKFNEPIIITIDVLEEESGLDFIEYSTDNETWIKIEENKIDLGTQYMGDIYIRATDICGNVSDIYEIKNLTVDFGRPTLTLITTDNVRDYIELQADELIRKGTDGYIRIYDTEAEEYMAPVAELHITNNRIKIEGDKVIINVSGIVDGRKSYLVEADEGIVLDMANNPCYFMNASKTSTDSVKQPSIIGVNATSPIYAGIWTGVLDEKTNEYNVVVPMDLEGRLVLNPEWDLSVPEIDASSEDVIIQGVSKDGIEFDIDNDFSYPITIQIRGLATKTNVNIYKGNINVKTEIGEGIIAEVKDEDILKSLDFKSLIDDGTSFDIVVSLNRDLNDSFASERLLVEEKIKRIENLSEVSEAIDINIKLYRISNGVADEGEEISELQNPLKISLELDSKYYEREAYNVIRVHNGKISVLPASLKGRNIIFKSDKFSRYFIAVGDPIKHYTPPVIKRDWDDEIPDDTWCIVPSIIGNSNIISRFSYIDEDGNMVFIKPIAGNYELTQNHKTFTDIVYNWNYEAVHSLAARRVIEGFTDGTFRPNQTITRAEFVVILARLENLPLNDTMSSFDDVDENFWYFPYIEAAYRAGLIDGVGNDRFAPLKYITREEMAQVLSNYLEYKGKDIDRYNRKQFNDMNQISSWAMDAINVVVNAGIIKGYTDGRVGPKNYATRAECTEMIWKFIKYIVQNTKDTYMITSYVELEDK